MTDVTLCGTPADFALTDFSVPLKNAIASMPDVLKAAAIEVAVAGVAAVSSRREFQQEKEDRGNTLRGAHESAEKSLWRALDAARVVFAETLAAVEHPTASVAKAPPLPSLDTVIATIQGGLHHVREFRNTLTDLRQRLNGVTRSATENHLQRSLDTFALKLKALETGLEEYGLNELAAGAPVASITHLPYALQYASMAADPTGDAAAAAPVFGAAAPSRLMSDRFAGSDAVDDVCGCCDNVVQRGAVFGQGTPRVHCLDCDYGGTNAVCWPCHRFAHMARRALVLHPDFVNSAGNTDVSGAAALAALRTALPHLEHHLSGAEFDTPFFLYSDCRDGPNQTLSELLRRCFTVFRRRPFFAFVFPQRTEGTTAALESPAATRRRTLLESRSPMLLTPKHCDLRFDAAAQASLPPLLPLRWASFGQIFRCVGPVAQFIARTAPSEGTAVGLSTRDAPLWYIVEMATVLARRCAVGAYALWQPLDILSAMAIAKAPLMFASPTVLANLEEAVLRGDASWPATLRSIVVVDWASGAIHPFDVAARTVDHEATATRVNENKGLVLGSAVGERGLGDVKPQIVTAYLNPFTFRPTDDDDTMGALCAVDGEFVPGAHASTVVSAASADSVQGENNNNRCNNNSDSDAASSDQLGFVQDEAKLPAVIVFTSGTSGGTPKGVISTAGALLKEWHRSFYGSTFVSVSASSPAWVSDKRSVWMTILGGGRVGFQCVSHSVFDTFRAVQPGPSEMFVPFLVNQLKALYDGRVADSLATQHRIQHNRKRSRSSSSSGTEKNDEEEERPHHVCVARAHAEASHCLFSHILGGRLLVASVGGAAVRQDLLLWLSSRMPMTVVESYGTTECGGVLRNSEPAHGSQVMLIDRPELGYMRSDVPFPRGEIAVKNGDLAKPDEWVCDDATRASIAARYLEDGWMLTGDIGELRPGGKYLVIDRASAVQKLANGKFFSPERVEHVIMTYLEQLRETSGSSALPPVVSVFVCADADNASVIAMFRLDNDDGAATSATRLAREEPASPTVSSIRRTLLAASRDACIGAGVPNDEVPGLVFIDPERDGWSAANGCLTASNKPSRRALRDRLAAARSLQGSVLVPLWDVPATFGGSESAAAAATASGTAGLTLACVAKALLAELVPSGASALAAAVQDGCNTTLQQLLNTRFADLGADSLTLSRAVRVVPDVVQQLRQQHRRLLREGDSTPPPIWTRSQVPLGALSVAALLGSSALSLAGVLWAGGGSSDTESGMTAQMRSSSSCGGEASAGTAELSRQNSAFDDNACVNSAEVHKALASALHDATSLIAPAAPTTMADTAAAGTSRSTDAILDPTAILARGPTSSDDTDYFEALEKRLGSLIADDQLFYQQHVPPQEASAAATSSSSALAAAAAAASEEHEHVDAFSEQPQEEVFVPVRGPLTVFLTGGAGFLGFATLRALLAADDVGRVVCLIRAPSDDAGRARLRNRLDASLATTGSAGIPRTRDFGGEKMAAARGAAATMLEDDARGLAALSAAEMVARFDARVVVVCGDLTRDHFGLSPENYEEKLLASGIDIVIHCAAAVKSWGIENGGFTQLLEPNVWGTLRVSRLALNIAAFRSQQPLPKQRPGPSHVRPVPLIHVSTVSVCRTFRVTGLDWNSSGSVVFSDLPLTERARFDAYAASKLYAEIAVRDVAWRCDGDLIVVRPPLLTWDRHSAEANDDDWISRLIDACVELRMTPSGVALQDLTPFAPVDACADEIVAAMRDLMGRRVKDESDDEAQVTADPDRVLFEVRYPYTRRQRLTVVEVLGVVRSAVNEMLGGDDRGDQASQLALVAEVPAHAWHAGMDAVTALHPTRYHPLLDQGIATAAGRARGTGGGSAGRIGIMASKSIPREEEKTAVRKMWEEPLRAHLRRALARLSRVSVGPDQ